MASGAALALYARVEGLTWLLGWIVLVPWLAVLDRAASAGAVVGAAALMAVVFVLAVFVWFAGAIASYTALRSDRESVVDSWDGQSSSIQTRPLLDPVNRLFARPAFAPSASTGLRAARHVADTVCLRKEERNRPSSLGAADGYFLGGGGLEPWSSSRD